MSGESAQDIEVSITAPNRSFHATVIASDVQWQDRTGAAEQQQQQPRRPIWSSAFGESTDIDSESFDPMVNSGTSLSQDSFDGFAVEFISSSKESAYTGLGDVQNGFGGAGDGGISAPPSTASAAFVAPAAPMTDAVSTSIGFAETDRGSISCEMITPTPVLVENGHVPSGETTVTSSTVSGPTVTSASGETTVTSSSSTTVSSGPTVTSAGGETFVSTVSSSSTTTVTSGPTVTSSSEQTTVTSSSTTVAESTVISSDSAVTTDGQQAPGSTFQMTLVEDGQEEHAVAPETPRDRAMSMHERSMLAHDLHSLASTMDTIKDENEEEMPVGSSSTMAEEKRPEEGYPLDRRVSLTGVPVSATTYIAPSQPTIFEAAESAAAAVAAAADVAPAADESSPYLKKLLDAQEATRQLMALLGESTQMLGLLPTAKKDEEKKEEDKKEEGAASEAVKKDEEKEEEAPVAPAADAAAPAATATDIPVTVWAPETSKDEEKKDDAAPAASAAAPTDIPVSHWLQEEKQDAAAAAAAVETASSMTFSSQLSSSSITSSSVSSTGAVAGSETDTTNATPTTPAAAAAAPATPTTPAAPAADLVVPPSPALEISSRPIDITFDDGSVVAPGAAAAAPAAAPGDAAAATRAAAVEIPVSHWQEPKEEEKKREDEKKEEEKKKEAVTATDIPVTVWEPETDKKDETAADRPSSLADKEPAAATAATAAAPSFGAPVPTVDGTQNATICSALESLASKMTTMTTTDAESSSSTTVTTTDAPVTLGVPLQLQPAASPALSPAPSSATLGVEDGDRGRSATPTPASLQHDSTISSLAVEVGSDRPTPEPGQERFVTNAEQSEEKTITKPSFSLESSTTYSSSTSSTDVVVGGSSDSGVASTDHYVLPSVVLQPTENGAASAAAPAAEPAAAVPTVAVTEEPVTPIVDGDGVVTTTAPLSLGVPLQLQPAASPGISPAASSTTLSQDGDRAATPTPASLQHESTISSLTVDQTSSRPTPEPDQERFVTNAQQSEVTMTKSSFTLESSTSVTSSTAEGGPSATGDSGAGAGDSGATAVTDHFMPATHVELQAEAASPAATLTPAAVDVPVEIVRHLDDAAAWHSAPAGADANGIAVPITIAPSGGPPPLAREPPLEAREEAASPRGPPPLAREAAEEPPHALERSVMVERRVLSPDSAAAHAAAPAPQQPKKEEETAQAPTPAGSVDQAPLTAVLQPAEPAAAVRAAVDVPVTVEQAPADPAPTPAPEAVPQASQEPADVQQAAPVLACELQAAPAAAAEDSAAPVASSVQQEQQAAAAAPAADDAAASSSSPTTAHAPISLNGTFQITPSEEDVAHPPAMLRDRAMSIHEKSLLAHEPLSGFQPGVLDAVAEDTEVHVASAVDRRRASVAPGVDGVPTSGFQAASTSCLFTVDEAAPRDEEEASTMPPSTATTVASSIVDVTAPEEAAKPPPKAPGVQWLTESEPATVVQQQAGSDSYSTTTAPATETAQTTPAADAPPSTPKTPTGGSWTTEPAAPAANTVAAPAVTTDAATSAAPDSAAPVSTSGAGDAVQTVTSTEAPPQTPKTLTGVTWVSEPAAPTAEGAADSVQTAPAAEAPPQTPKSPAAPAVDSVQTGTCDAPPATPQTPGGVAAWITEPAAPAQFEAQPQTPKTSKTSGVSEAAAAAPAASTEVTAAAVQTASSDGPPATPKTPTGVSWVSEPAAPVASTDAALSAPQVASADAAQTVTSTAAPPQTPKTPSGVSWISEPAPAATPSAPASAASTEQPPATPKTPGGVSWITEPATTTSDSQAPPQTPQTPGGVAWITEPAQPAAPAQFEAQPQTPSALPAAPLSPSVINITAGDGGVQAAEPPRTPTSPGIKWASDSERTGGNVAAAGAPPAPAESTFVVNAPWEGSEPATAQASAPDADGVTWITETAAPPPPAESVRPPLSRGDSMRSERDPSTATDITVREASPQKRTLAPSVGADDDLTNGVTQEALGTKVRKLSWADQQPSVAEDSFSAAIDDYEKKLNETTAQTKELVDLLCQTGTQITENSMKMSDVFSDAVQASVRSMLDQERKDRAAAVLSPIAENGEPLSREPPPQLVAGALPPNVESVIVSCPELKYVTGSLVLENANILVTDEESGLFLFTLDSKVVRHVTNPAWKRAASPVIFKDRLKSYILILMDCKDAEDGAWVRHIVRFTENLDYIEKVECPKWIREKTLISDRLAVNRYENIYYSANGELFSGLYELAPTGKWTELLYRQSESFIDMLAFAIIGPIQQILIVEGRRDHVLLCSIRESVCVEARRMAICERPGALAKDESGRLFVMNRSQAAVQIVDTRVWAACRNMALVDKFVPHFSASFGMLVIPQKKAVKVHKYAFEWDD